MGIPKERAVSCQLNTLFNLGTIRDLTDGQLLERFAAERRETAELAFAALVERHGAMVSRVCRAVLDDPHDEQDAFQATFLILIMKARALWVKDSLGPWLHQVAFRTASCARSASHRRRRLDQVAAERASRPDTQDTSAHFDREQALHAEIDRLPEHYRQTLILCDLQGYTCEEAARRIGRPVGTIKSWRTRGRERLRARLIRLGLAPSAGLAWMSAPASASGAMTGEPVPIAVQSIVNRLMAREVPATVQSLIKGVMTTMLLTSLRTTAVSIFAVATLAAGLAAFAGVADSDSKAPLAPPANQASPPKFANAPNDVLSGEPWSLSLREAIRIGLDRSEIVHIVSLGAAKPTSIETDPNRPPAGDSIQIALTPGNSDHDRLQAEIMAHVRSVEQQYWSLHQQQTQKQAAEQAIDLARDLVTSLEAKQAEGHGDKADLNEARQRLEQFQLDLLTKTSDVITTERQLRQLLNLPAADGRRIIPSTAPTEAKVIPDWDQSLATMLEKQPDITKAKASLRHAADLDVAKKEASPTSAIDHQGESAKMITAKFGQRLAQLEKENTFLNQVIHQTTHSLARFFLEIDANYKQFKTAQRLRVTAAQRREAQKALYKEGRITIDRYLDAVSQDASAAAQEAQFKTSYNISIVALEEAKGTLLEYAGISIVEAPPSGDRPKHDRQATVASHELSHPIPAPLAAAAEHRNGNVPIPMPPLVAAGQRPDAEAKAGAEGKTYSFQLSIGRNPTPFEIKGTFTVSPNRPAPDASRVR